VTSHAAEMRLKELTDEVARRHLNNTVTHEFMDRVEKEAERLEVQIANYKKSKSMGSYAPPRGVRPRRHQPRRQLRSIIRRLRPWSRASYSADLDVPDRQGPNPALKQAAIQRTPFKVTSGQKASSPATSAARSARNPPLPRAGCHRTCCHRFSRSATVDGIRFHTS
jgi:hypothetical protein